MPLSLPGPCSLRQGRRVNGSPGLCFLIGNTWSYIGPQSPQRWSYVDENSERGGGGVMILGLSTQPGNFLIFLLKTLWQQLPSSPQLKLLNNNDNKTNMTECLRGASPVPSASHVLSRLIGYTISAVLLLPTLPFFRWGNRGFRGQKWRWLGSCLKIRGAPSLAPVSFYFQNASWATHFTINLHSPSPRPW